ncbi:hypothetical protein CONLIGDRAFT_709710 [Coniochaeta ligniaria NRRL 30616]|uniref:Xylanolytic transcriptional activator regulatory domain-containing protein n=1 Tax=Coniochaeta ligniaria NRRL 30616 TaxID=1408157 RepID=A0A1J7JLT7_9PEZI|nr:hypothetical protein CONLIGDRAFT_709710 [Coniochaeta ligniaria NRRL 30616]
MAIIEQSRQSTAQVLNMTFAQAVLAIGSHTCLMRGTRVPSSNVVARDTRQRLSAALRCFHSIRSLPDGLLKLQVLLLLVIISGLWDQSMTGELVTAAVQCARNLRLIPSGRPDVQVPTAQFGLAERAVLFLYYSEASHAMHHGMPPLMDRQWITLSRNSGNIVPDDLTADCSLVAIIHSIVRRQYSPGVLHNYVLTSSADRIKQLDANEEQLKKWLASHPASTTADRIRVASAFLESMASSTSERKSRLLHAFCLYHRAVFFVFCPWIASLTTQIDGKDVLEPQSTCDGWSKMRSRCVEAALDSAFAVIEVASILTLSDTMTTRSVYGFPEAFQELRHLLPLSICLVLISIANGGKTERSRAMPYLGFFAALLGRLAAWSEATSLLDEYFKLVNSDGLSDQFNGT